MSQRKLEVELGADARQRIQESRGYIEARISGQGGIYGVNTGFGAFSNVQISPADIVQLQKNLIRSHSSGVGEPLAKSKPAPSWFCARTRWRAGIAVSAKWCR